jgi:hypothetical protein
MIPTNQSLAQSTKFRLSFSRLPYMTFFCNSINLPGISSSPTQLNTPFSDLPVPGDKIEYEPLEVSFLVDEDYRSWLTVHDWVRGITFPTTFDEYKKLGLLGTTRPQSKLAESVERPQYSDAILTLYTNKNNPHIRVKFRNCFPISLSSINFSTQDTADIIISGSASFKFDYYDIERV